MIMKDFIIYKLELLQRYVYIAKYLKADYVNDDMKANLNSPSN